MTVPTLNATNIITGSETDNGNMTIGGTCSITGLLTQSTQVHLSLYGPPAVFNSAGTSQTQPLSTGWHYFKLPSNHNYNWIPSYTNNCELAIPYTGLYAISWSMAQSAAGTVCSCFISKNLMNGSDINSGTDTCIANIAFSLISTSLSATAYLLNTDYINVGYYLESGSQSLSNSNLTLLQKAVKYFLS